MKGGLVVVSAFRFLTVFGMTGLGKAVRNDRAGEGGEEMTLLGGEVSLDAGGCVA